METKTFVVRIDENNVRYRTKLAGAPCLPGSQEARERQYVLLSSIATQPDLVACGPHPFQKLTISHDGERWIAEAEAVAREPMGE